MTLHDLNRRGAVLLGCGKMGSALLAGWLRAGLDPRAVHAIEPNPSDWLRATGVHLGDALPASPAVTLIAVKPQMMGAALPALQDLRDTLFVSIAAGTPLAAFELAFPGARVVRAMPNTPAAVGAGITAIVGNSAATEADLSLAETLLGAVGEVVRLDSEDQMDAVTGLSGSGPAYVFHMIETLAAAGEAEGLAPDLAMRLAKATVAGAGRLAMEADETPEQLRRNVTSPNGTTQAGLEVLMAELPDLARRTVKAAADRSRELRA
ncbi:pyrroline-5-carboxylate reductase [Jannaschia sp. W003]|uniref:pyrroline-5-carboxylate reductase n=1 Tax=Jannaschia sp. W003 TaxID=2867012 RepID=UPI0021A78003|nr:pyrroline-5-carboxylate reductase [Jannaschia sp. W003]UWQ22646.1 pyrroline-5-carboxylate reductase [Jannaschia sp. W003]